MPTKAGLDYLSIVTLDVVIVVIILRLVRRIVIRGSSHQVGLLSSENRLHGLSIVCHVN